MVLLIVAGLGSTIGYRLGMGREGFVALALVSVGTAAVQIGHLLSTSNRSAMTMLPLVIGAVLVAAMLAGATACEMSRDPSTVA